MIHATREYSHEGKVKIEVVVLFKEDGSLRPLSFIWEDGRKFEIDKVLDVCRAASLKAGGCGIRYTCMVRGKKIELYLDENCWFMER